MIRLVYYTTLALLFSWPFPVQADKGDFRIHLDGLWDLELVSCLPGDAQCTSKLSRYKNRNLKIQMPQNLHRIYPWFNGHAVLIKEFWIEPDRTGALERLDLLLAGVIGSVDRTYINGVLVGKTGYSSFAEEGSYTLSTHNKFRVYNLPADLLKPGRNTITVEIYAHDIKAGIHSGPIVIGHSQDLVFTIYGKRLLYGYYLYAIPVIIGLVALLFALLMRFWKQKQGFTLMLIGHIGYMIHSLYYIPVPIPFDYLIALKLFWSGRMISHFLPLHFFYISTGLDYRKLVIAVYAGLVIALLPIWLSPGYSLFFEVTVWEQWSLLVMILLTATLYPLVQKREARKLFLAYMVFMPLAIVTYLNDTFIRMYYISTNWLYHYLSPINSLQFFFDLIYHFHAWKDQEKRQAAELLDQDRINLANEMHDMVGSQLSQLYVTGKSSTDPLAPQVADISENALQRIRDFSHILKGQQDGKSIEWILKGMVKRLRASGRLNVEIIEKRDQELGDYDSIKEHQKGSIVQQIQNLEIERTLSIWVAGILTNTASDSIFLGYSAKRNGHCRILIMHCDHSSKAESPLSEEDQKKIKRRSYQVSARIYTKNRDQGKAFLISWNRSGKLMR